MYRGVSTKRTIAAVDQATLLVSCWQFLEIGAISPARYGEAKFHPTYLLGHTHPLSELAALRTLSGVWDRVDLTVDIRQSCSLPSVRASGARGVTCPGNSQGHGNASGGYGCPGNSGNDGCQATPGSDPRATFGIDPLVHVNFSDSLFVVRAGISPERRFSRSR